MSGASSWLQKQRKTDLIELADTIGFTKYDGLKKTELELALDEYITLNTTTLQHDARLQPYFKSHARRAESSPVKKEKDDKPKRRVTKAPDSVVASDEPEPDHEPAAALTTALATPLRAPAALSHMPLPPSPAVVADAIDQRTVALRRRVSRAYEDSGIIEAAHGTREALSTVVSVEVLILAFEAWCLRPAVLPNRYAFTFPAVALLGTKACAVHIPDMFLLLTAAFWSPVTLWLATSLLLPLLAAYFVNLTGKPSRAATRTFAYVFDPLTFNIAKALLTYVIYAQDATFGGLVDLESVARINAAVYGGSAGMLVGCGIGTLITLYEAALKK